MRVEDSESSMIKNIRVNDMITAHRKGIHIVTRIERRFRTENDQRYTTRNIVVGEEYSSLIYYRQVARDNGAEVKGRKEWTCNESYCHVLNNRWFQNKLDELEHNRQLIMRLRQRLNR